MTEINPIIKYISNLDSAGTSSKEIDTYLEYSKLGEYLNGGYINTEVQFSELKKSEQNMLTELYQSLKNKFTRFLQNETLIINTDNALEYAQLVRKLEQKTDETSELECKKIQEALYRFATSNGYDLADLKPDEADYTFIMREVNELIKTREDREAKAVKTLKNINTPYDNSKLELYVKNYIKENNIKKFKNSQIDLGNGKFDKIPTQKTNVCWALASINALLTTEKGKKLLESNTYYDKETGVFAIHLQEAEDNNFHDGIYIITPEEIQAESKNLAEGEGDAAAYLIAIKKYFEEVNQNPELAENMEIEKHTTRNLDEGNYGFRFFEILTGGKFSEYRYKDLARPLQNGIGSGSPDACGKYEYICDLINNKNGAVVLGVGEHSISVIGTRNGNLLIQESNNNKDFSKEFTDFERNHVIFKQVEDINGAPTYELSQDDYEHYIRATSFIKW